MFKLYSAIDYICIDIANCVGDQGSFRGDKELFEDRIQWVKDHYHELDSFVDLADNKPQYIKAVHALREVVAGKPTGHLVGLDASCSGIQLMSVMTGCIKGADATGLVTEKRADAYTDVTVAMNNILKLKGFTEISILRSDIKRCVMTAGYGSTFVPKEVFGGGELLATFYQASMQVAQGAFELMPALLNTWQPHALSHNWIMPDNFHVNIKVMQSKEVRVEVDELNHATFTTYVKINQGSEKGLANVANLTHSVDSYLLRSVIRRASFDECLVKTVHKLMDSELTLRGFGDGNIMTDIEERLQHMLDIYAECNMVDVSIIDLINANSIGHVPTPLLAKLFVILTKMLELGSSPVLTVHDAYFAHPNHCNAVRYWYKELCAELAESDILVFLVSQIVKKKISFKKKSNNLASLIRNSNYGLC